MLVIGVEGALRAWRQSPPGPLAERLVVVLLVMLFVSIAGGLGLLVGGGHPKETLHFVYAIVALGVLPISDTLSKGRSPRTRGLASLVGALVALVVVARLFGTG
jgi:hypothetical protein